MFISRYLVVAALSLVCCANGQTPITPKFRPISMEEGSSRVFGITFKKLNAVILDTHLWPGATGKDHQDVDEKIRYTLDSVGLSVGSTVTPSNSEVPVLRITWEGFAFSHADWYWVELTEPGTVTRTQSSTSMSISFHDFWVFDNSTDPNAEVAYIADWLARHYKATNPPYPQNTRRSG